MTNKVTVLYPSTTRHEMWGGPSRYIRLCVYENFERLRADAKAFDPRFDADEVEGVFHARVGSKNFAGIMRLAKPNLTTEILIHESMHVAHHIYSLDVAHVVNLGAGLSKISHEREETFAYMAADITSSVMNEVYDLFGWPTI